MGPYAISFAYLESLDHLTPGFEHRFSEHYAKQNPSAIIMVKLRQKMEILLFWWAKNFALNYFYETSAWQSW